jgi:hypothetical protein
MIVERSLLVEMSVRGDMLIMSDSSWGEKITTTNLFVKKECSRAYIHMIKIVLKLCETLKS